MSHDFLLRLILMLCLTSSTFPVLSAVANNELDFDLNTDFSEQESSSPYFLGGYFESRAQIGLAKAKGFSLRQRLHTELSVEKDIFFLFADGNVDYDPAVTDWTNQDHEQIRAELEKGYLTVDTEYVDITAGRKVVRWGTGDGINPMDLFNPIDSRDPIANARSLARKPVLLMQSIIQTPLCALEGVFIPQAAVNSPALANSPWESFFLRSLRNTAKNEDIFLDDETPPNGNEYGIRASTTANGWDISLLYFAGYTNHPVYTRTSYNSKTYYEAYHPRFNAYGLAFAKGLSKGTIRGELAFKPETTLQTQNEYTRNNGLTEVNRLQGVIGIDWTFLTEFYVNAQYFMDAFPDGTSNTFCSPYTDGLTFKVSNKYWNSALETGIQGMVYLSENGLSVEPYAHYEIDDHWKLGAGFVLWEGDKQTNLGQYRKNDMVYLKLTYAF